MTHALPNPFESFRPIIQIVQPRRVLAHIDVTDFAERSVKVINDARLKAAKQNLCDARDMLAAIRISGKPTATAEMLYCTALDRVAMAQELAGQVSL
jgi:hypothetical protein